MSESMKRLGLAMLCMAVLCAAAFAGGKKEITSVDWKSVESGDKVTVTGRIRVVGNEPFTELVITDGEGRDWYVDEEERVALSGYEQKTIRVKGTVTRKEMILADGRKLEDRRIMSKIKIQD